MSISEKIQTINNKIEQNKVQYNLDRQTVKISYLSSGNISKYKFLIGEDLLPEKDLLDKVAALKKFAYSPLSKELKTKTHIPTKQCQELDKAFISNKDNKNVNESLIKKRKKKLQ